MGYGLDVRLGKILRNSLLFSIVVVVQVTFTGCAVKITPLTTVATSTSETTSAPSSGSTTTTTTATPVPVVTAPSGFASVTNFGDSITCGYYALPNDGAGYMYSNQGYATVLDGRVGGVAKDLCRGGDMAADMARLWVYPHAEPGLHQSQLYTVLIGANDAHFCGSSAGCLANWSGAVTASLTWLALPSADKVLGSEMTASGGWQTDMGLGEATTHNGAKLTFAVEQVVAGRTLHIAYRVFDSAALDGGTATVSVDGVPVATLHATVATGHTIATQNGGTDTVFLTDVPLGDKGLHSVTIVTTSAEGGFFSVLWAGASKQNYAEISGAPVVVIGQLTPTGCDSLNADVAQYNAALSPLVEGLVAEGMNVVVAPTAQAFDPVTEMVDMLHPNNAGHLKLAAVFASALPKP